MRRRPPASSASALDAGDLGARSARYCLSAPLPSRRQDSDQPADGLPAGAAHPRRSVSPGEKQGSGVSREWGIMPRWLTARSGRHAAETGGPTLSRAFDCRPRSGPGAGDRHLFGTSAHSTSLAFSPGETDRPHRQAARRSPAGRRLKARSSNRAHQETRRAPDPKGLSEVIAPAREHTELAITTGRHRQADEGCSGRSCSGSIRPARSRLGPAQAIQATTTNASAVLILGTDRSDEGRRELPPDHR
jgi:hypothetical protein